ncbi:OmpH family outer membrane protein [Alkalitalea saponilacus]|uniref:Periplasmic chaperone for outer membrane proteins Skp n=1 Tax=Alkalitalea saponilacus TaxID=889453 RepID=A0A1T5HT37_9BACT|nr:OmpH family outer membrane protein [Alkalitalea saponilacus]ASB48521.1 molecular chaperone Skp [Alkalitalea saponilacus]SKC23855.1 periplasmic chaperone for outer membrane proteins Skp [Alkalitalea saponilacus]
MRLIRNSGLIIIALLMSFGVSAQTPKFGHVSVADIILQMPEYQQIGKTMEDETAVLERQFTSMREELNRIEIEYENNFDTYTPAQRTAKEEEYAQLQQRVQEFFTNSQQTLQRRQEELQIPVLNKLFSAIEEVGNEHGFLYIFEINSGLTLFQSTTSVDVTPLVKQKLGIQN